MGFQKIDFVWHLEKGDDWLVQVETKSSKFGDEGLYHLEVDIGFFSRVLDDLMGWLRRAGFDEHSRNSMPVGVGRCHFEASLFDFNENAEWIGVPDNLFLPKDETVEPAIAEIAEKLEIVVPLSFDRYASYESLINCKRQRIGRSSQSKQASMYAAAACIKLGHINEARELLEDAVRPGSTQFMKDVGARLSKIVEMSE
ncbi:hypothetical protein [Roseovarius aestuarii]|uniref:Uncharacterized protein n=1 Tax=Roseovarius aestuarii TaxID=475083 RepID=A0A1X7BQX7_9RHOB|nr:hypothetical protein [Roseovarius aestuarii]SMC12027.1 hypothetical protein ROA7745_01848 [Roseovarius aestuarii]